MNIPDTTRVLAKIAAADQRTVGEADILLWAEVIPNNVEVQDALDGVASYYRLHRERIMPRDVILAARSIHARRNGTGMWYE